LQKIVVLSVTEAELIAATTMAQDMMYMKTFGVHQFESRIANDFGSEQQGGN